MAMNIRRARQIIKQHSHTAALVLKVLESGATDDRSLFGVMRKRGWKDGQGMLKEMIHALTVTGKVATRKGVHRLATEDEPTPEQLTEMAAQMKQLADQRSREMDPEQLRQLLEAGQSVVEAADLMTEAAERLREVMNAVRESRGLRTDKKV